MPVRAERIVPLLFLLFISYWLLKALLISLMASSAATSSFERQQLDPETVQFTSQLTYRQFLQGLVDGQQIQEDFINILKDIPFKAYFFETPKVTASSLDSTKFEFILAKAPRLEGVTQNIEAFKTHFSTCQR